MIKGREGHTIASCNKAREQKRNNHEIRIDRH